MAAAGVCLLLTLPGTKRGEHEVVVKDETLYLLGGYNIVNFYNDVWKSEDGTNWSLVTADAPWTARRSHQVVVREGSLYLLGGGKTAST